MESGTKQVGVAIVIRVDYWGAELMEGLTIKCVRQYKDLADLAHLGITISGELEHAVAVQDVLYAYYTPVIQIDLGSAPASDAERLRAKANELCRLMRQ